MSIDFLFLKRKAICTQKEKKNFPKHVGPRDMINKSWQETTIFQTGKSIMKVLTHYQTTNLRLFQTKEFAVDNFKFDKNGRNFSKWVENTVGKGEIARYEQFLLFPQCFQEACFQGVSKGVIVWEWGPFM